MPAFDWNVHNAQHVREHGVEPYEAENALRDPARLAVEAYNVGAEKRRAALGATEDGRVLFVIFTLRSKAVRVIMARDAKPNEKRRYRRRGR